MSSILRKHLVRVFPNYTHNFLIETESLPPAAWIFLVGFHGSIFSLIRQAVLHHTVIFRVGITLYPTLEDIFEGFQGSS